MKFGPIYVVWILLVLGTLSCAGRSDRADARQREALKAAFDSLYDDGLVGGDLDAIEAHLHAANDRDGALVKAQARRMLANVRFLRAIPLQWEIAHGDNPFSEFHIFLADDFISMGGLEIRGNRAVVPAEQIREAGWDWQVPAFVRDRGRWKIDVTPRPAPPSTGELAAAVRRYAHVLNETAEGIETGKIRSIEEAKASLRRAPVFAPSNYVPNLMLTQPRATTFHH